eukprot:6032282-Alexandrium_andersonii.AAC.1
MILPTTLRCRMKSCKLWTAAPTMAPPPMSNAAGAVFGCRSSQLSSLVQSDSMMPRRQHGRDAVVRDADWCRLRHTKWS